MQRNLAAVYPEVSGKTPQVFLFPTRPLAQLLFVDEKVVGKGRVENSGKSQCLGRQFAQTQRTEADPHQDLEGKDAVLPPLNLYRAEIVVERQLAEKTWHVPASLAEALLTD